MDLVKDNHTIQVVIQNTGMKEMPAKDCYVTCLTVYQGQADLELPGSLTAASSIREAQKAFGEAEAENGALSYKGKKGAVTLVLDQEKSKDNKITLASREYFEE